MRRLVLTLGMLVLATCVNTASVAAQQHGHYLTRWFGRRGWYVHLALVLPPWLAFLALLPGLNRHVHWPLPRAGRRYGGLVLALAGVLWVLAYRALGAARTGNGNFFGRAPDAPVDSGLFRLRTNPMYDSYTLALVGLALIRQNAAYLPIAAASIPLLHGLEAGIENRPFAGTDGSVKAARRGLLQLGADERRAGNERA